MKIRILSFIVLFTLNFVSAQSVTLNGITSGGTTDNNIYVVIGQTFFESVSENDFDLYSGIGQSQLQRLEISEEIEYGQGYNDNGFIYSEDTPAGNYEESKYFFLQENNYDKIITLRLEILPKQLLCDEKVSDIDGNVYNVITLAGYCWTKENMRADHYSDDGSDIPKAMIYKSSLYPDEEQNESIYGKLYTWYSAVKLNENVNESLSTSDVFIQGICPNGWHIPTKTEFSALNKFSANDLRSTEYWLLNSNNTNSTGFSALPAGRYNSITQRFEGFLTYTAFWSVESTAQNFATSLLLNYFCDTIVYYNQLKNDAISVRCVKNY